MKIISFALIVLLLSACAEEEVGTCSANINFTQTTFEKRAATYSCYRMSTSFGDIDLAVNKSKAPRHAKNFKYYVDNGYYNGTVFHRVIRNFMIQGGGFTEDLKEIPLIDNVKSEAKNGLSNKRCTLGAARTNNPDSAQSQFYINVVNNTASLDYAETTTNTKPGYSVFGHVINGMSVVDYISGLPTSKKGKFAKDVPRITVMISNIKPMACDSLF